MTVLALQPNYRHVGYAVFKEGTLIQWDLKYLGSVPMHQRMEKVAQPFLRSLLEFHEPDMVLLPKGRGTTAARNRFLRSVKEELSLYRAGFRNWPDRCPVRAVPGSPRIIA